MDRHKLAISPHFPYHKVVIWGNRLRRQAGPHKLSSPARYAGFAVNTDPLPPAIQQAIKRALSVTSCYLALKSKPNTKLPRVKPRIASLFEKHGLAAVSKNLVAGLLFFLVAS
ncbi:hypothetical protein MauCBS54593_002087 [Microsporum audouinii]